MSRKIPTALIRLPALLLALFFLLFATSLSAQEAAAPSKEPAAAAATEQPPKEQAEEKGGIVLPANVVKRAPADQRATLSIMNRKITRFRAEVTGSPPKIRIEESITRITSLFDQGITGPIDTYPIPRAVLIRIDKKTIFALVDEDLDLVAGETLESRAAEAVANLEKAISEAEEIHMPQQLLRQAINALVATIIFVLLIWLLRRTRIIIEKKFLKTTGKGLQKSIAGRIASGRDQRAKIIALVRRVVMLTYVAALLVLTYLWLTHVLIRFPFTRPWGEALGSFLLGILVWMGKGIISALPGLFTVLVIIVITRWVIRLIHAIFDAVEVGRLELPGIHPETAKPSRKIISGLAWLLALVVAYPFLPGSGTDAFKGLSVFIGLVISLGSTGIVNQLMSGLMLMYSRALREGDFVKVGDVEGTVLELGMLSTKVRTRFREEVTVPNAVVISHETFNYSRNPEEGVTVNTVVTIGYDTPWRQVHAMLEQAAAKTEGVRDKPMPVVLQTGLSDYYPEYKLIAVIGDPETRPRVMSQLYANIQDIFNEHGVQIMSPHYIADPPEPLIVPPDRRNPPPAPPEGKEDGR